MSNLYANRVFGEHPIAMWSFDDAVDFISQITNNDRDLTLWTEVNADVSMSDELPSTPFKELAVFEIIPTDYSLTYELELTGPTLSLTRSGRPMYSSFWIHQNYATIEYIDYGSVDAYGAHSLQRNYMPTSGENFWSYVSCNNMAYDTPYIYIKYRDDQVIDERMTYRINGMVLGEEAESFASESIGLELIDIDASTDIVTLNPSLPAGASGVLSNSVGSKSLELIYFAEDNRFLSQNTSMPLAYGSNSLVRLRSGSGALPSIAFDGNGFLNEDGKFDAFTFEFWMRVVDVPDTPKRIFGPLGKKNGTETDSVDGLWINNSVLSFVVGSNTILSYNVGVFSNPLLVHLIYTPDSISFMINGEIVATKSIDVNDLVFAETGNTWLGFWTNSSVNSLEIDCMSLFGYSITEMLAKRRFVWGQGVENISNINSLYNGKEAFSELSSSGLTGSVSYPNNFIWEAGVIDNLRVVDHRIQPREVLFPEIHIGSHTKKEWFNALDELNVTDTPYFVMNPSTYSDYSSSDICYIEFPRLGDYVQNPVGITVTLDNEGINDNLITWDEFGVGDNWEDFDTSESYSSSASTFVPDSPIFTITHRQFPKSKIHAYIYSGSKTRLVYSDGYQDTVVHESDFDSTKRYTLYFSFINNLAQNDSSLPNQMLQMIKNTNDLDIVFFTDGSTTFSGNIYSVGIVSQQNYINSISGRLPDTTHSFLSIERESLDRLEVLELCSYSWLPKKEYGFLYDDIGIKGYWQDYVPLDRLGGTITDAFGKEKISVDNIQFNIGSGSYCHYYTYGRLKEEYLSQTIADINADNDWYYNLADIESNLMASISSLDDEPAYYNTKNAFVRSFVAFQKTKFGIKQKDQLALSNIPNSGVLYVQEHNDYRNKCFELVDGNVIVPPSNVAPENIVMTMFLEFSIPGINTYPVTLRKMEFSSFAKNKNKFTPVGTKSGKSVYPFISTDSFYDFQSPMPFSVNGISLPYLFLGRDTGFSVKARRYEGWESGIEIPIPEAKNTGFSFDSIQFWCRRNEPFSTLEKTTFVFEYGTTKKIFTIKAYSGNEQHGIINVYDENGIPDLSVMFYQNGRLVNRPVINYSEWADIQVAFPAGGIETGSASPRIKVLPGMVYNNISYFPVRAALGSLGFNYRTWDEVESEGMTTYAWSDWQEGDYEGYLWSNVLIKGTSQSKKTELSQVVYKTYIGTQAISISSNQPLRLTQGSISAFSETRWSSTTSLLG